MGWEKGGRPTTVPSMVSDLEERFVLGPTGPVLVIDNAGLVVTSVHEWMDDNEMDFLRHAPGMPRSQPR